MLEAKSSETRIFVYKWTRTDGVEKLSIKPIKRSIELEKPFQKKGGSYLAPAQANMAKRIEY